MVPLGQGAATSSVHTEKPLSVLGPKVVLIARGRDAADVAITTTFGLNTLSSFSVWTEEVGAP